MTESSISAARLDQPGPKGPVGRRGGRAIRPRNLGGTWPLIGTLIAVAGWEVLSRSGLLPREIPPFTTLIAYLAGEVAGGSIWSVLAETMASWAVGFAIAGVVATTLGVVIGISRLAYDLTTVVVEFLRPIPPVVYLPLVLLVMGATRSSTVVLVLTGALWPLITQASYGTRSVDVVLSAVARAYGLTRWQRLRSVVLPSAASHIATGLRLTATIALVVTVMTEMLGTGVGLGGILTTAQLGGDYVRLFAYVLIVGIVGIVLDYVFVWLERRFLHWHPAHREGAA